MFKPYHNIKPKSKSNYQYSLSISIQPNYFPKLKYLVNLQIYCYNKLLLFTSTIIDSANLTYKPYSTYFIIISLTNHKIVHYNPIPKLANSFILLISKQRLSTSSYNHKHNKHNMIVRKQYFYLSHLHVISFQIIINFPQTTQLLILFRTGTSHLVGTIAIPSNRSVLVSITTPRDLDLVTHFNIQTYRAAVVLRTSDIRYTNNIPLDDYCLLRSGQIWPDRETE